MTVDVSKLTADDIISPHRYAAEGYPHAAWRALRRDAPLQYFDMGERPGFYAVVRRADIVWLSKQPERFQNGQRLAVFADSPPPEVTGGAPLVRHLLNMDPPEHGVFRSVASSWFTPRAIARRRFEVERITDELIETMRGREEIDFVTDFAAPLTLSVLADMLGVPREDWKRMFEWTNQVAGSSDPEYQIRDTAQETMEVARDEMFAYFMTLVEKRRGEPRDDMLSVLANAEIDGQPIPNFELLSYLMLLVVAGNETTRNAASGGLRALIENQDQLARLSEDPSLAGGAVEETVRWTSPVNQFCRTPVEDFEMHGTTVRAGESLCLFYASANRDEEMFEDPDSFKIDRRPNPHVGFGIGEHFCLGANLARLEIRVIYERLLPRFRTLSLAGPFERMHSSLLGGMKRMPIRYTLDG
jgi:cholest-4-en-3-one 26-monooxygenase